MLWCPLSQWLGNEQEIVEIGCAEVWRHVVGDGVEGLQGGSVQGWQGCRGRTGESTRGPMHMGRLKRKVEKVVTSPYATRGPCGEEGNFCRCRMKNLRFTSMPVSARYRRDCRGADV